MSYSVNTNTNALAALQTLNTTNKQLTAVQSHINTGYKINGAKDDASTFAIAQGMRGDIAGFKSISDSLSLGSATVGVALNAAQTISDTLTKLKAKVVQAQDSTQDQNAIQNDITAFVQQIQSTAAAAQFNGVNLVSNAAGTGAASNLNILSSLNRTSSTSAPTAAYITVSGQNLNTSGLGLGGLGVVGDKGTLTFGTSFSVSNNSRLQVTTASNTYTFEFMTTLTTGTVTAGQNIVVQTGTTNGETVANLSAAMAKVGLSSSYDAQGALQITSTDQNGTTAQGVTAFAVSSVTGLTTAVTTSGVASAALGVVESAISTVKTALSALGTASNQLDTQKDFVNSLTDTLTGGVGDLVDADLAAESAQLQSLQTKQQLGIQALSIANQGPGAVLSLFR